MKCKAKEILAQRRREEAYQEMGTFFLAFLDASTGSVLHDKYNLGKKKLQQIFNITEHSLSAAMSRMAADNETEYDTILTVLWKMTQDFKYYGFDYAAETESLKFNDPFDKTWHNAATRLKHLRRTEFVRRMSPIVAFYYAIILDYMHTEKGFGKGRLHDLYSLLCEDYHRFLGAYLRCDAKGDAEAQNLVLERQKQIEDIGLTLVDLRGGYET